MKSDEKIRKLERIFEELRGETVFVEGKRDKEALKQLGFRNVLTISGNLRQSCNKVKSTKVFILTDLDRRGNQLAIMAKNELESLSISADLEQRKHIAHLLNIRFFEEAKRAYEELKGEING
ncbi:hypothetical protein JXA56_02295 [Candidatus Micrarchaeota archaeon]|nr:hypothetical protein [Candidatus Micrarchaeota archaeon]